MDAAFVVLTDDLTDICHFCGEEERETDFNWVTKSVIYKCEML